MKKLGNDTSTIKFIILVNYKSSTFVCLKVRGKL